MDIHVDDIGVVLGEDFRQAVQDTRLIRTDGQNGVGRHVTA